MPPNRVTSSQKPTIYGWRKRCLYCFVVVLFVAALFNAVATFLLIDAISFNFGGMGYLAVACTGVHLRGIAYVMDSLVTSKIKARRKEPIIFAPTYNMTFLVSDTDDPTASHQALHFWTNIEEEISDQQAVTVHSPSFTITDVWDREMFGMNEEEVRIGTNDIKVQEGGVRFSGSIQTDMVRSHSGRELLVESVTRRLRIWAAIGVSIESRASDISVTSLLNLVLRSRRGKIRLKGPGIYIPQLETFHLTQPKPTRQVRMGRRPPPKAYQVCMCSNGKLFLASPTGRCTVYRSGYQCR